MEAAALIAGSGWASGINLYLVALLLGAAGRLGWADIPDTLTRLDVMIVAGVLYAIEFVADKVPFLDSFWDVIHTVIRPLGAAAIGAVIAGESASIGAAVGAGVAGALALDAHAAKASTRVVVNTSPEPISNIGLSLAEDVGVAGLVTLAVTYPVPTIVVVAILVVAATALTVWIWRIARRSWKKLGAWLEDQAWYPSTG
ncbi:MAG TPA: DUF4126 domain-containing protein [Acidimicrobiia bacterium]|nr:DUF4126 domain-containing protein [Acidimicrobiia bacterium]